MKKLLISFIVMIAVFTGCNNDHVNTSNETVRNNKEGSSLVETAEAMEADSNTVLEKTEKEMAYGLHNPVVDENGKVTWDCVYFGNYYQNSDKKKEPIKWRVLSVQGDDAFLMSDQVLECHAFSVESCYGWKESGLRKWLNEKFLEKSFSKTEQKAIIRTEISDEDNLRVRDKVYILSKNEVRNPEYGFCGNYTLTAKNTAYVQKKAKTAFAIPEFRDNGIWWLRSVGYYIRTAQIVISSGVLVDYGENEINKEISVRPVLHLNLKKENVWSDGGIVTVENRYSKHLEAEKVRSIAVDKSDAGAAVITENGNLYAWGCVSGCGIDNVGKQPIKIMENVSSIDVSNERSAAVTLNGDLYIWGDYDHLKRKYFPQKFMKNVKLVGLGDKHGAAVKADGSLYVWGSNYQGQLGDKSIKSSDNKAIKIMDDVDTICLAGNTSAAIKKDGTLYMWGKGDFGLFGKEYPFNTPVKIMENVASVSLSASGNTAAVIKKDGSLYVWGSNLEGQLGNGKYDKTNKEYAKPIKLMENVKAVTLGECQGAAIQENGDLYTWGSSKSGELGQGEEEKIKGSKPRKILDQVESISMGAGISAAVQQGGKLYLWGIEVGDLVGKDSLSTPKELKIYPQ